METRVSTKGRVALPGAIRRKLGLRAGDPLNAQIEDGRIVLTPRRRRSRKGRIATDPITGLPVLTVGANAPQLSSKEVQEILTSFP